MGCVGGIMSYRLDILINGKFQLAETIDNLQNQVDKLVEYCRELEADLARVKKERDDLISVLTKAGLK